MLDVKENSGTESSEKKVTFLQSKKLFWQTNIYNGSTTPYFQPKQFFLDLRQGLNLIYKFSSARLET